ncbi:flagellar protein FliS [Paenibacillus sp. 32O-W]|jgi:flagellar biosynthetic protein FliS|uniref:Flagellar secretion chaperone FliS n=1 Tax=Paenibacillus cisolokensis TaxID=1658519 RepID=A0ABQ4N3U3_9BACL|nr:MULTISPECIES: flagellar export chaperone FliS [Paenibacillus]ALS26093.1 flagellar protein FliS [Paenibacillus sp. 32O-W]GIQ62831.1 flagellar protein FliS [Paenibacillus cisolokensis]
MHMPNYAGYQSYNRNRFETASPHRLILMLFEGALKFAGQAERAIEKRDISGANQAIQKTQSVIYELISSLDLKQGGQLAVNLQSLYFYMIDCLVEANMRKDTEKLREVIDMLTSIKSAWEQIGKEVALGQG